MRRVLIHDIDGARQILARQAGSDRIAWDVLLTEKENDSGSLSFSIGAENPEYEAITTLRSEIVVEDDGVEIWRGRVTGQEDTLSGRKKITVKGLLDYFHDSIIEAKTFEGSAEDVLSAVIAAHNASGIEQKKKFAVGTVTGIDDVKYELNTPKKAWPVLKDLIKQFGGAIFCRRDGDVNYVDWLGDAKAYRPSCSQVIKFGKNLMSLKTSISGDDVATVIYGYGKKSNSSYLTATSVNDGKKYVYDPDAVAAFGWIEDVLVDGNISSASELISSMKSELSRRMSEARSLSAEAVDLSDLGQAQERIMPGVYASLKSAYHGIDEAVKVEEIRRYLFAPHRTTITLGASLSAASKILRRV